MLLVFNSGSLYFSVMVPFCSRGVAIVFPFSFIAIFSFPVTSLPVFLSFMVIFILMLSFVVMVCGRVIVAVAVSCGMLMFLVVALMLKLFVPVYVAVMFICFPAHVVGIS